MAVHLSIGRISSISLLALLALAAGTAHYLSRSGPEPAPAPASQIAAAVPRPAAPSSAVPSSSTLEPVVAETLAEVGSAPRLAVAAVPLPPDPAPQADPLRTAPAASPPAASPPADAHEDETGPAAAPAAAPRGRVAVTRLAVARHGSPTARDLAVSASRPKNMAPIPTRAPRAATAGSIAMRRAAMLFQSGAEIRIEKDANLYITARNIPDNDRLLEAYNADRPNGGRVRTRFGEATAAPGLLGIAAQAHRAQGGGQGSPAYSLADAMRDAIWRKETAARLESLTASQSACAEGAGGTAKNAPSIGLSSC